MMQNMIKSMNIYPKRNLNNDNSNNTINYFRDY